MGAWIGITLKEVGGASTCGGLEAEGQEFFAPCLSEAILKRSAPEPQGARSPLSIPTIPLFRYSILPWGWAGWAMISPSSGRLRSGSHGGLLRLGKLQTICEVLCPDREGMHFSNFFLDN